jgi:hypothetical protein
VREKTKRYNIGLGNEGKLYHQNSSAQCTERSLILLFPRAQACLSYLSDF